jgi:acyl-coenzyme A synthetase/AMP-(fatty) acid ligase
MSETIPFLGHRDATQVVAWRAGRPLTAAEFLADVEALAQRLPPRGYAVNLCADRYGFAVAFAAALSRGQTSLLPPAQAPALLRQLAQTYGDFCILFDTAAPPAGFEAVRVETGNGRLTASPRALAFAGDALAAIAFTSGSTGLPVPNRKTWGAMAIGAVGEAARFGLLEEPAATLVGTVPAQHMYGLESTVLMALNNGLALHAARPFYPADVRAALEEVPGDRVLVTTPVHLRALLAEDIGLPPLRLAVCATAPLAEATARAFEARHSVALHEVYGFTEAGMVATRRTTSGPAWQALPGVRIRADSGQVWVGGGHVPAEVAFGDIVELIDATHFRLQGRSADIVNVAGKRSSIAYLDSQLAAIPGVEDGVFFLPEESGERVTRLAALVVAPALSAERLLAALRERIDPAFLPRPLHLVARLPRNATGKLPRDQLLALARRCAVRAGGEPLVLERSIAADHPALPGHFPGNPVVPGVVLLDEVIDAASEGLGFDASQPWTVKSAKFLRPVRPGERLSIRLMPDADDGLRFECRVGDVPALSGALVQRAVARA